MSSAGNQNFPNIQQGIAESHGDLVDSSGKVIMPAGTQFFITTPWLQFFISLWTRTGAGSGGGTLPSGSLLQYAGVGTPAGGPWLPCNGATYSKSQYPTLAAALGVASGTFAVPNFSGRFARGTDGMHAVGDTGGADTVTLTVGQLPAHMHGIDDPGHTHTVTDPGHSHALGNTATGGGATAGSIGTTDSTGVSVTGITNATAHTGISTEDTGSGDPVSIDPPFYTVSWWIKT